LVEAATTFFGYEPALSKAAGDAAVFINENGRDFFRNTSFFTPFLAQQAQVNSPPQGSNQGADGKVETPII
jgi:hypothetical protein